MVSPHPYIPATEADRARMLERIGVDDLDTLFADLPPAFRDPAIDLLPALTEPELIGLLADRAGQNAASSRPSFLGAGAYRRSVPSVVSHLVSRSEFSTAYTPYQPEISQGTLQSGFEFQSVVCELTGMDVANVGLYDVASATAEACLMAARTTKRQAVALLEPIHPGTA
ncbi:MAG: glycine dehydrogenase, partial [Chloroflexi bacterium]|nr:glycine dehydrogenase [Chloroflexota bacterium]